MNTLRFLRDWYLENSEDMLSNKEFMRELLTSGKNHYLPRIVTNFTSPENEDNDVIEGKMVLLLDILFRMRSLSMSDKLPVE